MRPESWSRVREVFHEASSLPVDRRATFLSNSCADDAALRAEIEALLDSHDRAGQFLEDPPTIEGVSLEGRVLGHYRINSMIGSGGMGDVYAARDTRLDRSVAIKVLSGTVANDPYAHEFFEREARAVAALNHPHICTLHDIGGAEGCQFFVFELLEGETLAERLTRGAVPLDKALEYGIQITSALDAVHRAGIIHRDLKPGNVMLTKGGVKLLDFGISKLPAIGRASVEQVRTAAVNMTASGFGTVAYMAPELFEGRSADARTDIFAFGAVLYEMVTGHKSFSVDSVGSRLAATSTQQIAALNAVPTAVTRVIQTCLSHDPDDRWQSARDLTHELKWIANDIQHPVIRPAESRRFGRVALSALVAVLLALAVVALYLNLNREASTLLPAAFEISTPPSVDPTGFAISPDGRRLVFVANAEATSRLWLRPLDRLDAQPLARTDGAAYPFWSADGRHLGFFADGKLKRLDIESGDVRALADAPTGRGGTWNADDVIVYAPATAGALMRVQASGGLPTPATQLAADHNSHRWPQFLPDGRRFLFLSSQARAGQPAVFVASLDDGAMRVVIEGDTPAAFAPPDQLLFVQRGSLVAAQFDLRAAAVTGPPRPIVTPLGFDANLSRAAFSISGAGVLVHRATIASARQLCWVDRSGRVVERVGPVDVDAIASPELTRDGRRIVVSRLANGNADVWTIGASGVPSRFTFGDGVDTFAVWSADGARILFTSVLNSVYDMVERDLTSAAARPLLSSPELGVPTSVSPDGRVLVYSVQAPATGVDVWALPLNDTRKPFPIVRTPFDEMATQFSPDGKWIAYQSNSSGRIEIYVRSFDPNALPQQISAAGGSQPRWRRDGTELYYIAADGQFMAVTIKANAAAATLESGVPTALFHAHAATGANIPPAVGSKSQYDVGVDGRFLINMSIPDAPTPPLRLSLDWRSSLAK